jgi:hypothetical protein
MTPAFAKPAHRRLRAKLEEITAWNEVKGPTQHTPGSRELGILSTGISAAQARDPPPAPSRGLPGCESGPLSSQYNDCREARSKTEEYPHAV